MFISFFGITCIEASNVFWHYVGASPSPHRASAAMKIADVTMTIVGLSVTPCSDASLHLQPYLHATLPQHETGCCSMHNQLIPAALVPSLVDQNSRTDFKFCTHCLRKDYTHSPLRGNCSEMEWSSRNAAAASELGRDPEFGPCV
jgi:hypothetical protein